MATEVIGTFFDLIISAKFIRTIGRSFIEGICIDAGFVVDFSMYARGAIFVLIVDSGLAYGVCRCRGDWNSSTT